MIVTKTSKSLANEFGQMVSEVNPLVAWNENKNGCSGGLLDFRYIWPLWWFTGGHYSLLFQISSKNTSHPFYDGEWEDIKITVVYPGIYKTALSVAKAFEAKTSKSAEVVIWY